MQFLVNLLRVGSEPATSGGCFLMLTQLPADGRMELRGIVEGAFLRYVSEDDLIGDLERASLSEVNIEMLTHALAEKKPLAQVGVLTMDSGQLRALGFQTLAKVADILRVS